MFVAANKGSYIAQAGRANHLADAFKYVSAFSPNPGEIQQQGLKADTAKYISKVENEAKKDYYKTTGKALDEGLDKYNAAAKKAQGQQRMAGILGLTGALAYGTSKYFQDKNNPPPAPEERPQIDNSDFIDRLDTVESNINKKFEEYENFYKNNPYKVPDFNGGTKTSLSSGAGASNTLPTNLSNWNALGSTIAKAEGTLNPDGTIAYGTFYGGGKFTNFDKHPDIVHHTKSGSSAAAGGFQFMPETWNRTANHLKLTDFTPTSQEKAARQLTKWRGVDPDMEITKVSQLRNVFNSLSGEWAGLPNLQGRSAYEGINGNYAMSFNPLLEHFEKVTGRKLERD